MSCIGIQREHTNVTKRLSQHTVTNEMDGRYTVNIILYK